MFNFKIIQTRESLVYIILPDINEVTLDLLSVCFGFLERYEKIVFVCSAYEYTFLKLLLTSSKTLIDYKKRIGVELSHPIKYREIQGRECIIIYLNKEHISIENNKKAVAKDGFFIRFGFN